MAVLVEAISVIVREQTITEKMKGGLEAYMAGIPNSTHCTDGILHRVGFMTPGDVRAYMDDLMAGGLLFERDGCCVDFAVVDMLRGPMVRCDWLRVARAPFFSGYPQFDNCSEDFTFARIVTGGEEKDWGLAVPEGWTPDRALHGRNFVPQEETGRRIIDLGRDGDVEKKWHAEGGRIVYVGRTRRNGEGTS